MSPLDDILKADGAEPSKSQIVRVVREGWSNDKLLGLSIKLRPLRRRGGFELLHEDATNIGALDVLDRIVNLHACENGLYTVVTCNEKRDWETGYVDDYGYKLVRVHDLVMAALKLPDGRIVSLPRPARHSDLFLKIQQDGMPPSEMVKPEIIQGFIRDDGKFVDRKEATELVKDSRQNRKPLRGSLVTTEDLW